MLNFQQLVAFLAEREAKLPGGVRFSCGQDDLGQWWVRAWGRRQASSPWGPQLWLGPKEFIQRRYRQARFLEVMDAVWAAQEAAFQEGLA